MRFPFYLQSDTTNCGLTDLRIVLKYYGQELSIPKLHNIASNTREGSFLLDLSGVAENIGFKTIGVKFLREQLRDEAPLMLDELLSTLTTYGYMMSLPEFRKCR